MSYDGQINKKGRVSAPSIEHLTDDLLLEILCRLPCYATAVRCRTVSKRWCSIVSKPLFLTHAFSVNREIKGEKQQSWALLINMEMCGENLYTAMVEPPHYCPRILSLQFLPYPPKVVAVSRDLVLCFRFDPLIELGVYYLCNPLTKQWMALPPYGPHNQPENSSYLNSPQSPQPLWAALVSQDGGDYRVVVNVSSNEITTTRKPFQTINLVIYLSEICQWRKIDVKIPYQPYNEGRWGVGGQSGIVCKGMVCLTHTSYFGAFNPFDVTDTFSGTLTATYLPLPMKGVNHIFESNGKLMSVEYTHRRYRSKNNSWRTILEWHVWKLDLNVEGQPLEWKHVPEQVNGNVKVEGTMLTTKDVANPHYELVGVHPYKEHLVYFLASWQYQDHQLVLCNTKSKTLKFLTRMPFSHHISCSHKLNMPSWPTPINISNHQ